MSFVFLYSVKIDKFVAKEPLVASWVNPVPGVAPSAPSFANAPKVALFVLAKAPNVTVNDVTVPVSSEFVADCTIAPLPLVPDVSIPVNSSTDQ